MKNNVLILSRQDDVHADLVIRHLHENKVPFFRINTEHPEDYEFTLRVGQGSIVKNIKTGLTIDTSELTSVWLRRRSIPLNNIIEPDIKSFTESEWVSFYRNFLASINHECIWVNHPLSVDSCKDKFRQLTIAESLGFEIPETIFSNSLTSLNQLLETSHTGCIYKAHDIGHIPDSSDKNLYTSLLNQKFLKEPNASERMAMCPGIFQSNIQKAYELRVNVIGEYIFATKIYSQDSKKTKIDWRKYDFRKVKHESTILDDNTTEKCFLLLNSLKLTFGAIDLAVTEDNEIIFFEINANGQWAWIEALTKQPLALSFSKILAKH